MYAVIASPVSKWHGSVRISDTINTISKSNTCATQSSTDRVASFFLPPMPMFEPNSDIRDGDIFQSIPAWMGV